jgi:hypothetical protein
MMPAKVPQRLRYKLDKDEYLMGVSELFLNKEKPLRSIFHNDDL